MKQAKSVFLKIISLCLVLVLTVPVCASKVQANIVTPYASHYLDAYNTYICNENGDIQVWFEVIAAGYMDEVGTLSIELYEVKSDGSLKWLKTFMHTDYPSMLDLNDNYIYSHVSYRGSATKTYKAYVCIWAGKDGNGDTRYMWAKQ